MFPGGSTVPTPWSQDPEWKRVESTLSWGHKPTGREGALWTLTQDVRGHLLPPPLPPATWPLSPAGQTPLVHKQETTGAQRPSTLTTLSPSSAVSLLLGS